MVDTLSPVGLALERDGALPVYRQIYARIRDAILAGDLAPGARLPSTRSLAGALGLITHLLLRPGDAAWIEDPGYFLARQALARAGARPVPVPVDGDGLDIAAGLARAPDARFAVVTPSHQSPLGVTLSLPRRLALLAWAARTGAWIVEDDYDSE